MLANHVLVRQLRFGILTVALLAVAAAGCSSGDGEDAAADTDPSPAGHTYVSTAVEGGDIPGGGPMTLTFEGDRISANSGCNTGSSKVDLAGGVLRIDGLASTLIGCPGDRAAADGWQEEFLTASPRWELNGDELILTGEEITVHLTDKKVADPDRPLVGTTWRVTSLITEQAHTSSVLLDEVAPELLIGEDGTLTGSAGCNRLTGSADITDDQHITFAAATTKMACAEDVMAIEQTVLRALDGTVTATVDADELTLRNDNGAGLVLQAE